MDFSIDFEKEYKIKLWQLVYLVFSCLSLVMASWMWSQWQDYNGHIEPVIVFNFIFIVFAGSLIYNYLNKSVKVLEGKQ